MVSRVRILTQSTLPTIENSCENWNYDQNELNFQNDFASWMDIIVDRYKTTEYKQPNSMYLNLVDYAIYDSYSGVRVANLFYYRIGTTIFERELPDYARMVLLDRVVTYTSLSQVDTRINEVIQSLFDYIRINDTTRIFISDVCGLQDALDLKANSSDVYTICQVDTIVTNIYDVVQNLCGNVDIKLEENCQSVDIKLTEALECFNLTVKALDTTFPIKVGDVLEFIGDNTNINVRIDGLNRVKVESCTNWSQYVTQTQLCNVVEQLYTYNDVCSAIQKIYIDCQDIAQQYFTDMCVNLVNCRLTNIISGIVFCGDVSSKATYEYVDFCVSHLRKYVDTTCQSLIVYIDSKDLIINQNILNMCTGLKSYIDAKDLQLSQNIVTACQSSKRYTDKCVSLVYPYVDSKDSILCAYTDTRVNNLLTYVNTCDLFILNCANAYTNCQIAIVCSSLNSVITATEQRIYTNINIQCAAVLKTLCQSIDNTNFIVKVNNLTQATVCNAQTLNVVQGENITLSLNSNTKTLTINATCQASPVRCVNNQVGSINIFDNNICAMRTYGSTLISNINQIVNLGSSGIVPLMHGQSNYYRLEPTNSVTVEILNDTFPTDTISKITLEFINAGNYSVSFPQVNWIDGSPSWNTTGKDYATLYKSGSETIWSGVFETGVLGSVVDVNGRQGHVNIFDNSICAMRTYGSTLINSTSKIVQLAPTGYITVDYSQANFFKIAPTGIVCFNIVATIPTNTVASFMLEVTNGGTATDLNFNNVVWSAGVEPTWKNSGTDVLGFYKTSDSVNWYGTAWQASSNITNVYAVNCQTGFVDIFASPINAMRTYCSTMINSLNKVKVLTSASTVNINCWEANVFRCTPTGTVNFKLNTEAVTDMVSVLLEITNGGAPGVSLTFEDVLFNYDIPNWQVTGLDMIGLYKMPNTTKWIGMAYKPSLPSNLNSDTVDCQHASKFASDITYNISDKRLSLVNYCNSVICSVVLEPNADVYDVKYKRNEVPVLIIAGEVNAEATGSDLVYTDTSLPQPSLGATYSTVKVFNYGKYDGTNETILEQIASTGNGVWQNYKQGSNEMFRTGLSTSYTGIDERIAYRWNQQVALDPTLPVIHIIKVAVSGAGTNGTGQYTWAQNDEASLLALLKNNIKNGLQQLYSDNKIPRILGMVWVGGEEDSKTLNNSNSYLNNLETIYNYIKRECGVVTLPFFPVKMVSTNGTFVYKNTINTAHSSLVNRVALGEYIDLGQIGTFPYFYDIDNTKYNYRNKDKIAEYLVNLIINDNDYKGCYPTVSFEAIGKVPSVVQGLLPEISYNANNYNILNPITPPYLRMNVNKGFYPTLKTVYDSTNYKAFQWNWSSTDGAKVILTPDILTTDSKNGEIKLYVNNIETPTSSMNLQVCYRIQKTPSTQTSYQDLGLNYYLLTIQDNIDTVPGGTKSVQLWKVKTGITLLTYANSLTSKWPNTTLPVYWRFKFVDTSVKVEWSYDDNIWNLLTTLTNTDTEYTSGTLGLAFGFKETTFRQANWENTLYKKIWLKNDIDSDIGRQSTQLVNATTSISYVNGFTYDMTVNGDTTITIANDYPTSPAQLIKNNIRLNYVSGTITWSVPNGTLTWLNVEGNIQTGYNFLSVYTYDGINWVGTNEASLTKNNSLIIPVNRLGNEPEGKSETSTCRDVFEFVHDGETTGTLLIKIPHADAAIYFFDIFNALDERYTSVRISGHFEIGAGWSECTAHMLGESIRVRFGEKNDYGYILFGDETTNWTDLVIKLNELILFDNNYYPITGWEASIVTSLVGYTIDKEIVPNTKTNVDMLDNYHASDLIAITTTCSLQNKQYTDACASVIYSNIQTTNNTLTTYVNTCASVIQTCINKTANFAKTYTDTCNNSTIVCMNSLNTQTVSYINACANTQRQYIDVCASKTLTCSIRISTYCSNSYTDICVNNLRNYVNQCVNQIYSCINTNKFGSISYIDCCNFITKQYVDGCVLELQCNIDNNYRLTAQQIVDATCSTIDLLNQCKQDMVRYTDRCSYNSMLYTNICVATLRSYVDICAARVVTTLTQCINSTVTNSYNLTLTKINDCYIQSKVYTDICSGVLRNYVNCQITCANNNTIRQVAALRTFTINEIDKTYTYTNACAAKLRQEICAVCSLFAGVYSYVDKCASNNYKLLCTYTDVKTLSTLTSAKQYTDICVNMNTVCSGYVNTKINECASRLYIYVDCQINKFIATTTPCSVVQRNYLSVPHVVIPANTNYYIGITYEVGVNVLYVYYKGTLLTKNVHYIELGDFHTTSMYIQFLFDITEGADLEFVSAKEMNVSAVVTSLNCTIGDVKLVSGNGITITQGGNDIIVSKANDTLIDYIQQPVVIDINYVCEALNTIYVICTNVLLNEAVYAKSGLGGLPLELSFVNNYTGPVYWVVCNESQGLQLSTTEYGSPMTITASDSPGWYLEKAGTKELFFNTDDDNNFIQLGNLSNVKMKIISPYGFGYCSGELKTYNITFNGFNTGYTIDLGKKNSWELGVGNIYEHLDIEFDILDSIIGGNYMQVTYYGTDLDEYNVANIHGNITMNSKSGFTGIICSVSICSNEIIKNGTRIIMKSE